MLETGESWVNPGGSEVDTGRNGWTLQTLWWTLLAMGRILETVVRTLVTRVDTGPRWVDIVDSGVGTEGLSGLDTGDSVVGHWSDSGVGHLGHYVGMLRDGG